MPSVREVIDSILRDASRCIKSFVGGYVLLHLRDDGFMNWIRPDQGPVGSIDKVLCDCRHSVFIRCQTNEKRGVEPDRFSPKRRRDFMDSSHQMEWDGARCKQNPEKHAEPADFGQVPSALDSNIKPSPFRMCPIDLRSGRGTKALHAVVTGPQ